MIATTAREYGKTNSEACNEKLKGSYEPTREFETLPKKGCSSKNS